MSFWLLISLLSCPGRTLSDSSTLELPFVFGWDVKVKSDMKVLNWTESSWSFYEEKLSTYWQCYGWTCVGVFVCCTLPYPCFSCVSGSGPGHTQQMETSAAAANQNPGSLASVELNSTLALKAQLQCVQVDKFIFMMYLMCHRATGYLIWCVYLAERIL